MPSATSSPVSYTRLIDDEADSEDLLDKGSTNSSTGNYIDAVNAAGFGRFHALLLVLCGWANMSDAAEILSVSFLLPNASRDMDIGSFEKGLLTAIVFLGMLVGGYFWGSLADIQGRRQILVYSLSVNSLFGILSSISQNFWLFLTMRFFSGIGVGGSMPVIFAYFSEFQPANHRGAMISGLSTFWMFGNIVTAALAWAVIPREHLGYHNEDGFSYESWRIFIVLCCVPAASSAVTFIFLPESPKYLLEKGDDKKALEIMKKIYCWNNQGSNPDDYPIQQLVPSERDGKNAVTVRLHSNTTTRLWQRTKILFNSTVELFKAPLTKITMAMIIIFFCLSFGYYGLWMWFPELFIQVEAGGSACRQVHANGSNATDVTNSVYQDAFYTALSNLPGNILTIILMDRLGRKILLTTSLIVSGLSVFFIWFLNTRVEVLAMSITFGAISVIAWNTLNVVGVELYPTSCRSTALGVQSAVNRIGAIVGNLLFGTLIELNCAIPMLMIAVMLAVSGLTALFLPDTTRIALK